MDIKESSIFFDKKNQMYKIDLWFYTRFFDYIIFAQSGKIREFWKENIQISDFKVDENIIIWCSDFFGWKVINIFYTDTFEDIYRLVQDVILVSFCIKWVNYYVLLFLDLEWNIWYYSNFKDPFYDIVLENNLLQVINNRVDTVVFSKELSFVAFEKITHHRYSWNSLFDVYFLENNFNSLKNEKLIQDLYLLDKTLFIIEKKFWVLKFWIFDLNHIQKLKKLFLNFNTNQILMYLPENTFLQKTLDDFEDISKLEFEKVELDFQLPENIFEYDEKYLKFQKDIIKLQYILYSLKISYKQTLDINTDSDSSYIELSQERLQLTKENLEKNIVFYENKYNDFIHKISLNKTNAH